MPGKLANCPILESKRLTAKNLVESAVGVMAEKKMNFIWLEATGCSGNIISLMNAEAPDLAYLLTRMVSLRFSNSLMAAEGERAFREFLQTLETEFILAVEGAVSVKDGGLYNILARYQGRSVPAMEAVQMAGAKAKHVIAVGTCASHGGISAAKPNPSESVSVGEFLERDVINVPGCPAHPDWFTGTLAHLLAFGVPEIDEKRRPVIFYGITIHDLCPRRSYFDQRIFARELGDKECMFKLGCRGPVTRTDCPTRQWNGYLNWPVEDNTPCIGCAREGFPDGMEPFVRY